MNGEQIISETPNDTFALGERLGKSLVGGEILLLYGGLGAGKTLLTKGILNALDFDIDEVTSPSFTLVNLYKAKRFDVYHIDLWRLDRTAEPAKAVGLGEIVENDKAITIIEWADRLDDVRFPDRAVYVEIEGDGEGSRKISIESKRMAENRPLP